jgi:hypothetical protein
VASTPALWSPTRTTLSGSANLATRIDCPAGATLAIVRPVTSDAKLAFAGTDNVDIGSAYLTLGADTLTEVPVAGRAAIYVAGSSSAVVEHVFANPPAPEA